MPAMPFSLKHSTPFLPKLFLLARFSLQNGEEYYLGMAGKKMRGIN
jgi:hypothetical protein